MLGRDARPGVAHRQNQLAVLFAPYHFDVPTRWCVTHRIADQIGHRTVQLRASPRQHPVGRRCKVQLMDRFTCLTLQSGKRTGIGFDLGHQKHQRHGLVLTRQGAALQLGQRQQIAHQRLHAACLHRHELQVVLLLLGRQRQTLQSFHKTRQHSERRADFMRHIGHEIAAHLIGLGEGRDITGQQQLLAIAIRVELHREFEGLVDWAGAPIHLHLALVTGLLKVAREHRIAHQMHHMLPLITLRIQPQMLTGRAVAPGNAAFAVEQRHPVGRSLDGIQKLL